MLGITIVFLVKIMTESELVFMPSHPHTFSLKKGIFNKSPCKYEIDNEGYLAREACVITSKTQCRAMIRKFLDKNDDISALMKNSATRVCP